MKSYFWDIETSTITCDNGEEMQVTFLSNIVDFNMETCEYKSYFFRTIEETREFFKTLEEGIIYSHNLDYELSFLIRDMENPTFADKLDKEGNIMIGLYGEVVKDSIYRDKHAPLSIRFEEYPQLTFKDSLALFSKSVKKLGADLIKRGEELPKLNYNYEKVRLPWDSLEQLDFDYNERDNIIVAYSIYFYMLDNGYTNIEELPLTFTGAIRKQRKQFIIENYGKYELKKYQYEYDKQLKDYNFFNLCTRVYQGGLTTSALEYTNKFIGEKVYSIDIKSSYPYQMCTKRYPCYYADSTSYLKGEKANKYYHSNKIKFFMGSFNFINIRCKNGKYLLPVSTSQIKKHNNNIVQQNMKLFNGKLISADNVLLHCNNIDIDTINLIYDYDYVICEEIYFTTKSRYLRESEVSFLLHCFNTKENTPKNTFEYNQSKSAINGQYGIKVTSPIRSSYYLDNGEVRELDYYSYIDSNEYKEEIFNNFIEKPSYNNLDIYTDGLYITSYARYMLLKQVVNLIDLGACVVYSDTDSIKFFNADSTIFQVIEYENQNTIKRNLNHLRFKQYKEKFNVDNKTMNKLSKLGIWEIENYDNPYTLFVTYGAKKYAYLDNEGIHITIAGCNKNKPIEAITKFMEKRELTLEETFKLLIRPGTTFDIKVSGRTVAKYEDRSKEELNYLTYEGRRINQYGGIIIKDTTYTLGIGDSDCILLNTSPNIPILTLNKEGDIY